MYFQLKKTLEYLICLEKYIKGENISLLVVEWSVDKYQLCKFVELFPLILFVDFHTNPECLTSTKFLILLIWPSTVSWSF